MIKATRIKPSGSSDFRRDVIEGLSQTKKSLPCKYFYDERGSKLFEQITELEEYYPTRTEMSIIERHTGEIVDALGHDLNLVEFGSGSSRKTELLLQRSCVQAYVPIDIATAELCASSERLKARFPELTIIPVIADYTQPVQLPSLPGSRNVVFFPGSTIGNFEPSDAAAFLKRIRSIIGNRGALLIGVDLRKDKAIIEQAYNDRAGITAQFNLNLIDRINRELGPEPALTDFGHRAIFNEQEGRIEMQLIAEREQSVEIGGQHIAIAKAEVITTEYSYKYTLDEFERIADKGGLVRKAVWMDPAQFFSVQLFAAA